MSRETVVSRIIAPMLLAAIVAPAGAAVSPDGKAAFTVEHEFVVAGSSQEVWDALIHPRRWWHDDHTWSGSAANLSLEARAGGCFCETWNGGSNEHMRVIHARPGMLLRLRGALGPLQSLPANGVMSWEIREAADGGTALKLSYRVAGAPAESWAAPVDGVLGQQVSRLERLLKTGSPSAPEGED